MNKYLRYTCAGSLPLLMAACAGITDVVATGPDTYMVASHGVMGWSSGSAQKARSFQKADDFCKKRGKRIEVISTNETPGGFGKTASGEVRFRCIKPDTSKAAAESDNS